MSERKDRNVQGRKRKRSDAGLSGGQAGKKEARKVISEDVLSSAPQSVKIVDFVENRASEIIALTNQVEKIGGTKLVSQRLPRHMRRRALSHDIRRLPKRLREAAAKEIERAGTTKKPSRKHRRRPKNLLDEYERRKRRVTWLETHIWHAKRFHMTEQWGYKLALHPNDKSMRACHRAADKYSLLQDVSYECCYEITGPEDLIKNCLSHVVSDKTGPTLRSKQYTGGSRWGSTMMFECDQYPKRVVGDITFLWRPPVENKGRQLWIWCHPACSTQVWQQLKNSVFLETGGDPETSQVQNLTQKSKSGATVSDSSEFDNESCQKGNISLDSDKKKNGKDSSKPCSSEEANSSTEPQEMTFTVGDITLKSLRAVMPKFRLTGKTSQAIVAEVLQTSDIEASTEDDSHWWQKYYQDHGASTKQKMVSDWLKSFQSPAETPPHQVISLTVRDPRLLLPPKRTKLMSSTDVPLAFPSLKDKDYDSALWEKTIRQEVNERKMSTHNINKKRAENLVPGTPLNLGKEESRIPVLLMQRPGYRETITKTSPNSLKPRSIQQGFGCGWDVVVPPGWGMPFLVAFVFRGCRVGGLREAQAVAREAGELAFPQDFPDSPAGRVHSEEQRDQLQKKYDRNPPAKRPNFVKMGIQHPFICPWPQLVKEWKGISGYESTEEFHVLRDLKMLKLLKELLCQKMSVAGSRFDSFPHKSVLETFASQHSGCLVAVRVTMHAKGIPSQFSTICIPNVEDLESFSKDSEKPAPSEPKHPDPQGVQRKKEKKQKKCKKSKTVMAALANPSNPVEEALSQLITKDPSNSNKTNGDQKGLSGKSLVTFNCRDIIGYVNDGDFSLGQGQGHGKAFCSLLGLLQLGRRLPASKPCPVLVRNTTTLQYRFAWLTVLL